MVFAFSKVSFADECYSFVGLVREHIPTDLLNDVAVWTELLQNMPMTAMIRNLGKMTSLGMFDGTPKNKDNVQAVVLKLTNEEALHAARVHPVSVLLASSTYKSGGGFRGKLHWEVNSRITDALEKAFLLSFKNVKPTGKRMCLALDVSGSMGCQIMNSDLSCRDAAAALSMIFLRTEPLVDVVAFSHKMVDVCITKNSSLSEIIEKMDAIEMGGTDCALPMLNAIKKRKKYDVFMVFTDNETWYGNVHPFTALKQYRHAMDIPDARLIVFGMTATEFTIADPADPGMLDVVGFDSAVPEVVREFLLGNI
ncbi:hypothetical protein AB6A40_009752 [Gnathostoma spinigerum]|uniref:TROVE domain-containing protein n=1 Tax=Gnathostoma spinigerum TaxID=75299 RepID=A0ABD6ET98_9BILA